MTRIKANNVQMGNKYLLPAEQEITQEIETQVEKILRLAKEKQQELISQAEFQAKQLLTKTEQAASEILSKAQKEAENLVNAANGESEGIREQAYKEGYEAGYKQGYEDGTKSLEQKFLAVETFAKSKFDMKQSIIKSAEGDILELIIAICEKVCQKSFEVDKTILKDLTLSAVKQLKDKEQITITINPQLAEMIYSISDELKAQIPKLESIKVIEDSNISADGTIVESLLSRVDSRIKTQINEIAEKLMKEYNSTELQLEEDDEDEKEEVEISNENLELNNVENLDKTEEVELVEIEEKQKSDDTGIQ